MRRGILQLAVALALAAGPVAPAQAAGPGGAPSSWPGLHSLWSWLAAVVTHQPVLQSACDWGSQIDPNGGCRAVAAPLADCGSQINPDGRCRAAAATQSPDRGSQIDPNG
jgi:hypothetical protein